MSKVVSVETLAEKGFTWNTAWAAFAALVSSCRINSTLANRVKYRFAGKPHFACTKAR